MSEEICVHSPDPLQGLLVGEQPHIGVDHSEEPELNRTKSEYPDLSSIVFPEPIKLDTKTSTGGPRKKPVQTFPSQPPLTQFSKLKGETSNLEDIDAYLGVYETNHRRKALLMHQEVEEQYLQPVQRRISKKVTGDEYQAFLKRRKRAIAHFDARTKVRDTFNKPLPTIPTLTAQVGDLVNPITRFRRHAQREAELTDFIAKSTGTYEEPPTFKENDTMNLKQWRILAETRFYAGTEPASKGKRVFDEKFRSSVADQIDQF